MTDDFAALLTHFSDPDRYQRIDPRRAIWLTDDNIRAMARDKQFMETFRRLYG